MIEISKIKDIKRVKSKLRFLIAPYLNPNKSVFCHGVNLFLNLRNFPQKTLWAYRELYEANEIKFLRTHLKPCDVFVDVGANAGLFSKVASKILGPNGKIFAFEPDKEALVSLYKNLKSFKNINIIEKYVTNIEDKIFKGTEFTSLDKSVKGSVNFIKIDVDGPELSVLKSGVKIIMKWKPFVMLEIAPDMIETVGISHMEIINWMKKYQYTAFNPDDLSKPFIKNKIDFVQNIVFIPNKK